MTISLNGRVPFFCRRLGNFWPARQTSGCFIKIVVLREANKLIPRRPDPRQTFSRPPQGPSIWKEEAGLSTLVSIRLSRRSLLGGGALAPGGD